MTSQTCPPPPHRSPVIDALVSSAPWTAAGAYSLWRAWAHWRALGDAHDPFGGAICGRSGIDHCAWCYSAAGFAVAAVILAALQLNSARLRRLAD